MVVRLALTLATIAFAQTSDARYEARGSVGTLTGSGPRPVEAIAAVLAAKFGLVVNTEDAIDGPLRTGRVVVAFDIRRDGAPKDAHELVESIARAANMQISELEYRLSVEPGAFTLAPIRAKKPLGRIRAVKPLLDRVIDVPPGRRTLEGTGEIVAAQLSRQAGLRVSCCGDSGWGVSEVDFDAQREPARSVLRRLIEAGGARSRWAVRCAPGQCTIDVLPVE